MSSHVEEASVGRPQASDWARSHKRKPRAGPGRPPKRKAYGVAKMAHELKGTGLCRRFLIAIGYEIARDSQALAAFHQALADGLAAPEAMELAHEGMRIAKETASLSADVTAEEAPLSADVTAEEAEAARRAQGEAPKYRVPLHHDCFFNDPDGCPILEISVRHLFGQLGG